MQSQIAFHINVLSILKANSFGVNNIQSLNCFFFFVFFFGIMVYCPQLSYRTYTWNLHDSPHYGPCTAYYEY